VTVQAHCTESQPLARRQANNLCLLAAGIDACGLDNQGQAAAHLAAVNQGAGVLEALTEAGMLEALTVRDKKGNCPLMLAAQGICDAVTHQAKKLPKPNGKAMVRLAAKPQHQVTIVPESLAVIKALLGAGACVNETLAAALETPHATQLIDALFEAADCDLNKCSTPDGTLLHAAAQKGNLQACRVLISRGADVHSSLGSPGRNVVPIIVAAQQGHIKVCLELAASGAPP
jgi:ankyrin repeat protein